MGNATQRRHLVTRVIRAGESVPVDLAQETSTPESRMAQVWELTQLCLAMRNEPADERRLQRSVVHIQRAWR